MVVNPFMLSIRDTSIATGCSQKYIRQGVRDGKIPHIKVGKKYMINLSAFIEQLNEQSKGNVKEGRI